MEEEYTAAPSLNLTPEEKRVFGQLFREADKENIGVVTGEVAVKFFEKTRLEPRILGEVCTSGLVRRLQQNSIDGA
jgi:epidermal growth factor receptor substrate 15